MEKGIEGRTALITGGRSGMGRACAQLLAEKGANVVIVSRDRKELEKVAKQISVESRNKNVFAISGDVSNGDDVKHIVDDTMKKFKRVDYLLNFAGYVENYGKISPMRPSPEALEFYRKIRSVDQDGTVMMTFYVEPIMRKQKSGVIITISSTPVLDFWENDLLFQIAKSANIQLTKTIASQLRVDGVEGVRIYNVAPGNIFNRSTYESLNEEQRRLADEEGWLDSYQHVAKVIYWIMTGKLKLQNGDVLRVDSVTAPKIFSEVGEKYEPFLPHK
jgi:gluconate 5-dehydrogenase